MAYRLRLPTPLPVTIYFRCKNARSRPKDLRGEWIADGQLYTGTYEAGCKYVRLDERYAEPPHRLLDSWRFREVARVWLN